MAKAQQQYLEEGRLQDVLALIQALALSSKTRRTEAGLTDELQGKPNSANSWIDIGFRHREFFRVRPEGKKPAHIALIARNVQDPVEVEEGDDLRPLLTTDTTAKLMQLAVDLHAREVQVSQAWRTVYIPILISVVAAAASISAAVISAMMRAST